MGDSTMMDHLEAAKRELDLARADPKCGSCKEVLDAEAEHLDLVTEAMRSAEVLSVTQVEATDSYRSGVAVARKTVAAAGLPPVSAAANPSPAPDAAPRPVGFVREVMRDRVRITDVFSGIL